mmetsp:Transcript_100307/g.146441  ORF Transcript_100307/g.146441 Transcript_100307/m.146441 type:complete len:274 (+) Transcript_100307:1467-2288(+)
MARSAPPRARSRSVMLRLISFPFQAASRTAFNRESLLPPTLSPPLPLACNIFSSKARWRAASACTFASSMRMRPSSSRISRRDFSAAPRSGMCRAEASSSCLPCCCCSLCCRSTRSSKRSTSCTFLSARNAICPCPRPLLSAVDFLPSWIRCSMATPAATHSSRGLPSNASIVCRMSTNACGKGHSAIARRVVVSPLNVLVRTSFSSCPSSAKTLVQIFLSSMRSNEARTAWDHLSRAVRMPSGACDCAGPVRRARFVGPCPASSSACWWLFA